MSTLDEKIREALGDQRHTDPDLVPQEESVWSQWFGVYHGRNRWINLIAGVLTFALYALAVWCAVAFFGAESVRGMLSWGFGFIFCALSVGNLKLWHWMQMDKNCVLREVKRLELQVALLVRDQPR